MAAFDSVDQARVLQFKNNVTHLFQQKGSRLRGKTREEGIVGKAHFYERLAALAATLKSTRHADTILLDPQHSRRMVVPQDYVWNALVDQQDKIRLLIDPNSEYAIMAARALKLAYDDAVIAAFTADAATGESGGTAVTFANDFNGTRTSTNGDWDPSAAALTTVDVLKVKKDMDENEVDAENRYWVAIPAVFSQLLSASTAPIAASSDYNSIKALVQGEINTWVGFEWIMSNRLPLAAGTDYYTFAWQKDAMGVVIGKDIMARLTERADKDYAVQSYACMTMGATRIQGEGVIRIRVDANL
jgi:capsid protein